MVCDNCRSVLEEPAGQYTGFASGEYDSIVSDDVAICKAFTNGWRGVAYRDDTDHVAIEIDHYCPDCSLPDDIDAG